MVNGNDTVKTRMRIAAILGIPIAVALIVRYYVLQVKHHDYYFKEAQKRVVSVRRTEGKWGEILDRNGCLLVGNSPCVRISCAPCEIKSPVKRRKLEYILSTCLGKPVSYYRERLNPVRVRRDKDGNVILDEKGAPIVRPNNYLLLGRDVSIDEAAKLKSMLSVNRFPAGAFSFQDTYTRTYPKKRMLSTVLGYMNIVNDAARPQAGLEKQLADETSPETGRVEIERARDGTPLDYGEQHISAGRDGRNIYLTISEPIQSILEEELNAACEKWRPEALFAAIATPEGEILAVSQRPNYDPDDRSTFNGEALRNRIALDGFEPGSVMKPFAVAVALDHGVVTPNTRIDCEKGHWIYLGKPMKDTHKNELLTVGEVIQLSSNIGTAKIALMLGEDRLGDGLSKFGFGTRTGLPFPMESCGTRPRPAPGDKLTITRIPIGYAVNVTVLQLLRAYCSIANGGKLPRLRLIDRVFDPETGEYITDPVPPPVQVFNRPEAREQLVEMLISVTREGGTAPKAAIPGYEVAGKTGTSNKHIVEYEEGDPAPGTKRKVKRRYYAPNQYYASFAGFVPAHDPKLVMVVTVDHPQGSHYGGTVAAPIFAKTAERVLKLMNVPPDHPLPEKTVKAAKPEKRAAVKTPPPPPPTVAVRKNTPQVKTPPPAPKTRKAPQRPPARRPAYGRASEFPPMAP